MNQQVTEFTRRIDRGIYDAENSSVHEMGEKTLKGFDHNRENLVLSREEKDINVRNS